ncbi:hypothetical protein RclHR1_15820006 [Rhizophagus clarus]|uniref:Uncharacterized protein n=2 Tax=Rhizophagus clarus TaxID=94130 RepID=A0A2Z6QG52_9GLOM|nr:hypothetical protein RclHR1_15820006 [Rhizophagus clarus]
MSFKCPFCPRYFSTRSAYTQHKNHCIPSTNNNSDSESNDNDIEMVHENLNEDFSDNESIDSEINDQSFQSKMSISETDEIDQNENVDENILGDFDSEPSEEPEDSDSELNEEEFEPEIMSTSILKTHYRRSATVLTSEQIEEIRHLKNKVLQNGNHFFEELRKVQSNSSVLPSENNHPISGPLDSFHESIEMNAQEKQKKKKKLPKRLLQDQPKSIRSSDLPEILTGVFIKTLP